MPCPLLGRCRKRVDFDTYTNYCSSTLEEKWRECDEFKRLTSGERTPSEWSSVLSPFAPPPPPSRTPSTRRTATTSRGT